MEDFIRFQRKIMIVIAIIGLAAAGILYIMFPAQWSYATGLVFGVTGGLVVYRLKVLAIYRFARNPQGTTVKSGFHGFFVMIAFLVATILISKLSGLEILNKWTVLGGLILPNIILMVYSFFCPQKPVLQNEENSGEE